MSEQFSGTIDIRDSASNRRTIELDGNQGIISAGGNEQPGIINLFPEDGALTQLNTITVALNGEGAILGMGGNRRRGVILLFSENGELDHLSTATVELNGQHANLRMGSNQADGDLILQGADGRNRIHLNAGPADIHLGGNGRNGNLLIYHLYGDNQSIENTTIHLIGESGVVRAGGNDAYGAVIVRGGDNKDRIRLMSDESSIHLGGNGAYGNLFVYPSEGDNYDHTQATLHLNGTEGDIILRNADCAEDFDVSEGEEIEPGTVVVLNSEGQLQQSTQAYDKKVAGVISGAGNCGPGIILGRQNGRNGRLPVALTGKVYCKVDTRFSPIEVGDLLTTSPTPGHAMKAEDTTKAFGAVIGKAIEPLRAGIGVIPILVALQ